MPVPVIVHGNPCDGITIVGPFRSLPEAEQWAEANLDQSDGDRFWSTPLYSPDEFFKNKAERVKSRVIDDQLAKSVKSRSLRSKRFFGRRSGSLAGMCWLYLLHFINST